MLACTLSPHLHFSCLSSCARILLCFDWASGVGDRLRRDRDIDVMGRCRAVGQGRKATEGEGHGVRGSKGAGTRAVGQGKATGRRTWSDREQGSGGLEQWDKEKRQGEGHGVRESKRGLEQWDRESARATVRE